MNIRRAPAHFVPWLYDLVMTSAERILVGRWRRETIGKTTGMVLEVAAGTGLSFPYYRPDATVVATDFDLAMLERAGDRATRSPATVLLVVADARALPFRDGAFDNAVAELAMCTIPSPSRALVEVRRVVRSGGALLMLEHIRSASRGVGRIQDWLTPLWSRIAGGCRLNERTVQRVRDAGFRLDDVTRHLRGLVVSIHATKTV